MKNKRVVVLLATVATVFALGAGLSLAYFTDSADKENVLTMGKVDISLDEPSYDEESSQDLVPGQTVEKDPTITVVADSEDCYVRAQVSYTSTEEDAEKREELLTNLAGVIDFQDEWYEGDLVKDSKGGYTQDFYLKKKVAKSTEDQAFTLFTKVEIPAEWGNEFQSANFNINVKAQAVQASYFDENLVTDEAGKNVISWTDVVGWND